jgi:hypothetical protein
MNSKLITEGDKEVTIRAIKQWQIYSGLLEGMPTTRMNNQILKDVKEDAKKFCGFNEVYLIEPIQAPIQYDGKYPFGDPASLPPVVCIADLWHYTAFRDETKDFSSLGLIWFQNDYAFPIDEEVIKKIKQIPFSKICGEFTY